ncbi:uncharacterized protein LOC128233389 [Mya arenaria]|uniref:uncharacterized protein LOC128233389 n=1 Tax=Mya arenaria TaxID=6604 RepID=UPI0022E1F0A2|nr:uncharacterized protein LOC128233389 [Mya arenaria]XP_052803003.1 uncharacterized protein LOC128233389 [Mya arenaria]
MNCLLIGLVCVSLGMLVSSEKNTYRLVHVSNEGIEIAQDIVHDTLENTVTVVIGDVSMYKGHEATVNFHDFNTGYVAFKDIRRQLCLLSKAPVPYATPDIYAQGRTNMTLDFDSKIDPVLMSHDDVIKIAGEKLAKFCQHYRTYFRTLIAKGRYRREISLRLRRCRFVCGVCYVQGNYMEMETL